MSEEIKGRIDKILLSDFPSGEPEKVLTDIKAKVEESVKKILSSAYIRYPLKKIKVIPFTELSKEVASFQPLIWLIDRLENTTTNHCPYQMLENFKDILSSIFGDNKKIRIIVGEFPGLNYGVQTNLDRIFGPDAPFLISIPKGFTDKPLLNVLLGHEIGHICYKRWNIEKEVKIYIEKNKNILTSIIKQKIDQQMKVITREIEKSWGNDAPFRDEQEKFVNEQVTYQWNSRASGMILRWSKEIFCDLMGIRIYGPIFLATVYQFFLTYEPGRRGEEIDDYPSHYERFRILVDQFPELSTKMDKIPRYKEYFINCLESIKGLGEPSEWRRDIYEKLIRPFIKDILKPKLKLNDLPKFDSDNFSSNFKYLQKSYYENVPPFEIMNLDKESSSIPSYLEILNSAMLYQLENYGKLSEIEKLEDSIPNRKRLNSHVLRALELLPLQKYFDKIYGNDKMQKHVKDFFSSRFNKKCTIIITPILNPSKQIASKYMVDLRIGNVFIFSKKTKYSEIDPKSENDKDGFADIKNYQERVIKRWDEPFVLHPGQFTLSATLEYISLPLDCIATVEGRSSWGRLGLVIATATVVAPGFKGCLTLELINLGDTPIRLYPAARIAQLIISKTDVEGEAYSDMKDAKYPCLIHPEFSRIRDDQDWNDLDWESIFKRQ